jgi:hypothetical protein
MQIDPEHQWHRRSTTTVGYQWPSGRAGWSTEPPVAPHRAVHRAQQRAAADPMTRRAPTAGPSPQPGPPAWTKVRTGKAPPAGQAPWRPTPGAGTSVTAQPLQEPRCRPLPSRRATRIPGRSSVPGPTRTRPTVSSTRGVPVWPPVVGRSRETPDRSCPPRSHSRR